MKTFLKPLTSEEEKYYLQEYKRGSQEAKNILIERNLRLVAHIVKKYQGVEEDREYFRNKRNRNRKRFLLCLFNLQLSSMLYSALIS